MNNLSNNFLTQPTIKKSWLKSCLIIIAIILAVIIVFLFSAGKNDHQNITTSDNPPVDRKLVETSDDPSWGNPDAKVVIVEFSDFECPYCRQMFPVVHELSIEYKDSVKFIYRDFLGSESHEHFQKSAEAANCAHEQGEFLAYHDKLFLNQSNLDDNSLKAYARQVGIKNLNQFDQCLDTDKYANEIKQDYADGVKFGTTGTPTFFINGHKVAGTVPKEDFKKIIKYFLNN